MFDFIEEKWPELLIVTGLGAQLVAVIVRWL